MAKYKRCKQCKVFHERKEQCCCYNSVTIRDIGKSLGDDDTYKDVNEPLGRDIVLESSSRDIPVEDLNEPLGCEISLETAGGYIHLEDLNEPLNPDIPGEDANKSSDRDRSVEGPDISVEDNEPTGCDISVEDNEPTGCDISVEDNEPTGCDISVEANEPTGCDISGRYHSLFGKDKVKQISTPDDPEHELLNTICDECSFSFANKVQV